MLEETPTGQAWFAATVMNVAAVVMLVYGTYGYWSDSRLDDYAKTPGTIVYTRYSTTSVIQGDDGPVTTTDPCIEARFEYYVDGARYVSDTFTNLPPSEQWEAQIRRWVRAYPPGRHTVVRYDRDDPSKAYVVLMPRHEQAFGLIVSGAALLVLGVWLGSQRL